MDSVINSMFAQWGVFGLIIAFACYIIYRYFKDKPSSSGSSGRKDDNNDNINVLLTLLNNLNTKIDKIDDKVDKLEISTNSINIRVNNLEHNIHKQPQNFIKHFDIYQNNKISEHNKMLEDQMKLGPELHNILNKYKKEANLHHIFLGSFHNGTTSISGIPYCKFDIIAEQFNSDEIERDVEFAFMYKDSDILRHNKLPITLLNESSVHYVIDENKESELSEVDDIIYRRMVGRDIKQLVIQITRDDNGRPSGFVGGVRYDYEEILIKEVNNCAKELEIIYRSH